MYGYGLNNFFLLVQFFRGSCCSRRGQGLVVVWSSEGMVWRGVSAEW